MSASNYPITFGYRAQDGRYYGPSGSVGLYHRGNDRPCPTGTPIIIGSTTIGLTGASGLASGPHLHTQAMTTGTNTDYNPAPYEFKFGRVVRAGWHTQFGNHIRILVQGTNVECTYAHLSKINVSVGQVISAPQGGNLMFNTDAEVQEAYLLLRGNPGTAGERSGWIGQSKQRFFQVGKPEADNYRTERDQLRQQVTNITNALNAEIAKPPKEVVKEVVKIVEKVVEVPVETPINPDSIVLDKNTTWSWLSKLLSIFKKG